MKAKDMSEKLKGLLKYKYVLLVLVIGAVLIALPTGGTDDQTAAGETETASLTGEEARLERALGEIEGVGEVRTLLSPYGAVVICEGGGSAGVRLEITKAVSVYTGLGSDKITVLRMSAED